MNAAGLNTIAGAMNAYMQGTAMGEKQRYDDEDRQQRREVANYRKQVMDYQLKQLANREASGVDNMELQNLRMQVQATQDQLAKQATYSAFDAYNEDGDPRHLNSLLQDNQVVREHVFPQVLRVDNINLADANDARLFEQQTGTPLSEFASAADFDKVRKRFVKVTTKQGEQKITDMAQLYGGTGYVKYKSAQQAAALAADLDLRKKAADIDKLNAEANKANRMGTPDWVYPTRTAGGLGGTALERNAAAVGAARERLANGEGTEADQALVDMSNSDIAGTTPGKQALLDNTEQQLFSNFGGEDKFFSTPFTPGTEEYRKAERSVRKIEALSGVHLTAKQVENIGNIRKTIAAGKSAQGLTNADMGLVDSTLKSLGAYVSDDAMGAEARSAWAGIRNQLLHAFAGSAMNEGELARWGEQFGNLYQQGGPVLTTLANALNQLGGDLDSLRLSLPEASFHVRLGSDVSQLNSVIENIGKAAAALSAKAGAPVKPMTPSYPVNGQTNVTTPTRSNAELLNQMLQERKAKQGAQ
ncbi:MAG: hypothetical protein JHC33_09155 [Ignisphaera sp.]|nr:hypothetical protein [Ignisphaera sp.]